MRPWPYVDCIYGKINCEHSKLADALSDVDTQLALVSILRSRRFRLTMGTCNHAIAVCYSVSNISRLKRHWN
jgi:hypothetical protein